MIQEKDVSYQTTNTYSTLNGYTSKTRNVWVVFHGIGYLSRYFLKYFRHLDPENNYIIAPQAPSRFYLNGKYEHVGASWATKENTEQDIQNVLNYLDEIYKDENLHKVNRLILFGYSQGVSVVSRWIARRKIDCSQLILHSGGLPREFKPEDFKFMSGTPVTMIYGTEDEFLNAERLAKEKARAQDLFGERLEIIAFQGGHEVNRKAISKFV